MREINQTTIRVSFMSVSCKDMALFGPNSFVGQGSYLFPIWPFAPLLQGEIVPYLAITIRNT